MNTELERRIFDRKEVFPAKRKLQTVLRDSFTAYEKLLSLTEGFTRNWKFYGKTIGWQMKVERHGKALLYVTPLSKSFRVGLALREEEREALLLSQLAPTKKDELRTAVKYAEGYPLRFEVRTEDDMEMLSPVLDLLLKARS